MRYGAAREYNYRIVFEAPLAFVYRWCTDYSSEDPRLEHDDYERRVVTRDRHRVVYEDLSTGPSGWVLSRQTVTLLPPDRWHAEADGNYRHFRLDYRLRALGPERTELTFVGRRRPVVPLGRNPSRAQFHRDMEHTWQNFRGHIEREFRAGRVAARRRAPRRSGAARGRRSR